MTIAKTALNARSSGNGPETIVLVHGLGSDQSVWASYIPWLSQHYRVISYDLPFAGSADRDYFDLRRHGDLDGHAQDLIDILRDCDVERCILIGHSLGGLIGIFAAMEQPDLFERLILIGVSPRYLDEPGYHGGFSFGALDGMLASIAENFRMWAETFAPIATGQSPDDPAAQTFLASLLRARPDIMLAMAKTVLLGDYREAVKRCTTPAILLQTETDPAVTRGAALTLQQCLKGSKLEIIQTAGHLPHISAPDAMRAAFQRHLPLLREPVSA